MKGKKKPCPASRTGRTSREETAARDFPNWGHRIEDSRQSESTGQGWQDDKKKLNARG
jgi:hypothetical protein